MARGAAVSKRSVQDWETDRYVPNGAALRRLLRALEAPEGFQARLLAQAAPRFARIVLADTESRAGGARPGGAAPPGARGRRSRRSRGGSVA